MSDEFTIEDCLEMIVGVNKSLGEFEMGPADKSLFTCISNQIRRGITLTDRQYARLYEMMWDQFYIDQFVRVGISPADYKVGLNTLRNPLREIDRSKYITIVDTIPEVKKTFFNEYVTNVKSSVPWIKIGFPFSKKVIAAVDEIAKKTNNYVHEQGSRDHFFKFEEHTVYEIVEQFKNKEFEIDKEILEFYEQLVYIKRNAKDFLPGVRDDKLVGFHPSTEEYLLNQYGAPSIDNILQYKDRAMMFGIHHFETNLLDEAKLSVAGLTNKLLERESTQVLIRPQDHGLIQIVDSLTQLKRLPILVIVSSEQALADVKESYNVFKQFAKVEPSEVSVLFRLDNNTNADFNDYVKDQGLNTPVDEFTKIVYVSKDKLPKPLLKNSWRPDCVLRIGSHRLQSKIDQWIHECDLVVHYDTVPSQWIPNYSSKQRKIERI